MNFTPLDPPRRFRLGKQGYIELSDCGHVNLEPDELVTFRTESGGEYDVTRKSWGFYATPSLNGRLRQFGFRAALVKNVVTRRYFVFLLEDGKDAELDDYLRLEECEVVCWLDTTEELERLERGLSST